MTSSRRRFGSLCVGCLLGFDSRAGWADDPFALMRTPELTLAGLAAQLQRMDGVPHQVSGKVRACPQVLIHCPDPSAEAIRLASERLLGWRWVKSPGKSQIGYLLVRPAEIDAEARRLRSRCFVDYDSYLQALKLVNTSDAADPPNAPGARSLMRTSTAPALIELFGSLDPDAQKSVISGGGVEFRFGLGPQARREALAQFHARYQESGGTPFDPGDRCVLSVTRDSIGRPFDLRLTANPGKPLARYVATAPASWTRIARARAAQRERLEAPVPAADARILSGPLAQFRDEDAGVEYRPGMTRSAWEIMHLAVRCKLPVMADIYPAVDLLDQKQKYMSDGPFKQPSLASSTRILRRVLDRISDQLGYEWRIEGGWLLLRNREWYWCK